MRLSRIFSAALAVILCSVATADAAPKKTVASELDRLVAAGTITPEAGGAYRALHGYGHREASWTFKDDKGGWRLDHALLRGLEPHACAYAHDWRRAGLSDHSALVVDWTRQDEEQP